MKKFFVVDSENQVSWSAKTDAAESFSTPEAATKRAKALAADEPGQPVFVCMAVATIIAEVLPPVVKRG